MCVHTCITHMCMCALRVCACMCVYTNTLYMCCVDVDVCSCVGVCMCVLCLYERGCTHVYVGVYLCVSMYLGM